MSENFQRNQIHITEMLKYRNKQTNNTMNKVFFKEHKNVLSLRPLDGAKASLDDMQSFLFYSHVN